jgi:hypothetical protein
MRGSDEWLKVCRSLKKLSLCTKERFRAGIELLKEEYAENPRFLSYLNKPGGYFDCESWQSCWYRIPYCDLDGAWNPRTNNGLESFNAIVKSQFCDNRILAFPEFIKSILGPIFAKFSTEVALSSSHNKAPAHVEAGPVGAYKFEPVAIGPDLYYSNFGLTFQLESGGKWISVSTESGETCLVYLSSSPEKRNLSPHKGGCFCSCEGAFIYRLFAKPRRSQVQLMWTSLS